MQNFSFQNPTKIIFGRNQIAEIAHEIPSSAKVLVTYGGGSILRNGTMDQVRAALKGRKTIEFGGIEANPTYETLMKAVDLARKEGIDFLLAVGGGSVIDGTKFIAAAIPFDGEPWDLLVRQAPINKVIPLGTVLTLPATGSEMNGNAVISRTETKDKLALHSALVYPRFSVLDPTTTYTLPPRQVANGIVDAFVHIAEQYLTYPQDAAVQDRFAEGLLLTLIEQGPKALKDPHNYALRADIMWVATWALNGFIGVGVVQDWATHMLGHELTAMYGLDHAQTLAMVLPAMLRIRRESKKEKLLQYARRVWAITEEDTEKAIDLAIDKTALFFEAMGNPTKMSAYDLKADVPALIAKLEEHHMTALGEKGDVTLALSRKVLEQI